MSDTPVGERPAQGGNVRQYETAAERARAWRERQRLGREESGEVVSASMAEATLGVVLDRLGEVLAGHQVAVGGLVGRVEEAVAALADPDAVAEELAAVRAETARDVAGMQERVARSAQAKAAADAAAREAVEAANEAWAQLEALQVDLTASREAQAAAEAATADAQTALRQARVADDEQTAILLREHAEALVAADLARQADLHALDEAHEAALGELRTRYEASIARLEAETGERVADTERRTRAAEAEQARAEGVAAELRADLGRLRDEHAALQSALPDRIDAVRAEITEALTVRHDLEVDAVRATADAQLARIQGELAGAVARADAAQRLAEVYQQQLERVTATPVAPTPRPRTSRKTPPQPG